MQYWTKGMRDINMINAFAIFLTVTYIGHCFLTIIFKI